MNDIFISYRHNGGFPTANHISEKLQKDGYKVCFDKSSLKQGKFDEKILDQIGGCTDFIVVLDKEAFSRTLNNEPIEKDWLRRELAHAIKHKKNIIPVMLSGFEWPEHLPEDIDEIRKHNGPEYSRSYFNEFYKKLTSFLKTRTPLKKRLKRILLPLLLIGVAAGCFWYAGSQFNNKKLIEGNKNLTNKVEELTDTINKLAEKEPVLLFAGGGSVKGFIQSSFGNTALDNGIYMPMASTIAWSLIAEEPSVGRYEDYDEKNPRPYYLVLLSAEKATANQLIRDSMEFKNRIGYLIEIQIGESPLKVAYQNVPELDNLKKLGNMVSSSELKKILCNPTYQIYTTAPETSATWRRYNTILQSKLQSLKNVKFFEKTDDITAFIGNYIILESSTYYAEHIHTPRINVCDTNNQLITCPMFIYFVAYKTKNGDVYVVPEKVRSLLTGLGMEHFPKGDSLWYPNLIRSYNKDLNRFNN